MLFTRAFTRLCLGTGIALLAGLPAAMAGNEGLPGLPEAVIAEEGPAAPQEPLVRYDCDRCAAQFYNARTLQRHRARHDAPKVLACDKCDFMAAFPGNLARHARTHRGAEALNLGELPEAPGAPEPFPPM
jgi:hypothetical protein